MIMSLSRLRLLQSHIAQSQGVDGSLCRSLIPSDILQLLGDGACARMCLRYPIPDVHVCYFSHKQDIRQSCAVTDWNIKVAG